MKIITTVQGFVISLLIIISGTDAIQEHEPSSVIDTAIVLVTVDSLAKSYTWGILPAISYDTDAGFGFGGYGGVITDTYKADPFLWQLTAQLKMTAKRKEGRVSFPIHDHFLSFDSGTLLRKKLRLYLSLFYFNQIDIPYFGLGNNSTYKPDTNSNRYTYHQSSPGLSMRLKYTDDRDYFGFFSTKIRLDRIGSYQNSKLKEDVSDYGRIEQEKLHFTDKTLLTEIEFGIGYDSRDDELDPRKGYLGEFSLRASPGKMFDEDYAYWGCNASIIHFFTLKNVDITFGQRLLYDSYFGTVPFYRLAGIGGSASQSNIWGGNGVRGIPSARFHGETKLVGNLESRYRLVKFPLFKKETEAGIAAFWDFGRVWVDQIKRSSLDGLGFNFKHGFGCGIRLKYNEVLLLRIDAAYSRVLDDMSDRVPLKFYFLTDHLF